MVRSRGAGGCGRHAPLAAGSPSVRVRAHAPGRVNVIGEHTDYTGGLVLPMAIDLGTTVVGRRGGDVVRLASAHAPEEAVVPLDVADPAAAHPAWARYVAGVVAEVAPTSGLAGEVTTTLPVGAGLSSSAALEVAVALALGADQEPLGLARRCQRAEQRASGVPCGIMDQLASTSGVEGSLLLIDCRTEQVTPVPLPDGVAVVAVHSGQSRTLASSAYADRLAECRAAEAEIGPLRDATPADVAGLANQRLRRRARHVVTENARVGDFVAALRAEDLRAAGELIVASHRSLADDFEVSTRALDQLVERLLATPGVLGARLTGGGFGGAVVALVEPGTTVEGWWLRPSAGASVVVEEDR
ncbi:MAG: galactokinase [Acidimicrobiales bacterium]